MADFLTDLLPSLNEILASGIVVVAFSMLLYNLTRGLNNRVARTSSAVLACVTFPYLSDVFLSFQPEVSVAVIVVRLQWIGIAFMPSTMFHLSDALLATTGLRSRGRRKRVVRVMYLISALFLLGAAFTDLVIKPTVTDNISIEAGSLAFLYIFYFVTLVIATFVNMQRARQRCLTRTTKRRMGYLQYAILTPALGIFPFSLLINATDEHTLPVTLLVVSANMVVIGMLIFLSYPLSLFGTNKPDRLVKMELLHFLLRGPGTGLLALVAIVFTSKATRILGLTNEDFLPFAVVATVLMWQWGIDIAMPYLEGMLIYRGEDDEQLAKLQELSERILTKNDLLQFSEATLEAICDNLRVEIAFLIAKKDNDLEIVQQVGTTKIPELLQTHEDELRNLIDENLTAKDFMTWGFYQLLPLYSQRVGNGKTLIGMLGVQATSEAIAHTEQDLFQTLVLRAEQTLEDLRIQAEIFASLEGLLPQISTTRPRVTQAEYLPPRDTRPNNAQEFMPSEEEFYEQVRAALRHYWGGPGITRSRLIDLNVVQNAISQNESATVTLRNVIQQAVEKQRPDGERSLTAPEWTIYNILTLRFLEGKKVKDVARRMSMSEADLYRKQRLAIEAVASTLLEMEDEIAV